jgi:uncharacterized NAD(P)/FAD-binding protein YdhS
MSQRSAVIAIVGGGASGVLTAVHLMRASQERLRVVIIEPRADLGRGVAYGTTDLGHLLNVRAGALSALPDQPGHFTAWVQQGMDSHARSLLAHSDSFLPRAWYGRYLASLLDRAEHVQARVDDLRPAGTRVQVVLSDRRCLKVDRVVVAPGSSPSTWPGNLGGTGPRWICDPWAPGALAGIPSEEPVLLLGSGLTAVDVALSLGATGNRHVLAASRHGLLPRVHPEAPLGAVHVDPPKNPTARSLLQWARTVAATCGDWTPVVDALRPHTDELWGAMAESERSRLLRHVHRRWEVVRHRMPPSVGALVESLRSAGQLKVVSGAVGSARTTRNGVEVTLADRIVRVGAVVNCSGPSADVRRSQHPLVQRLLHRGLAHPSPLGLGLETDTSGCMPDTANALWLVGPLRRGHRWETSAIPEIRTQAAELARSMLRVDPPGDVQWTPASITPRTRPRAALSSVTAMES